MTSSIILRVENNRQSIVLRIVCCSSIDRDAEHCLYCTPACRCTNMNIVPQKAHTQRVVNRSKNLVPLLLRVPAMSESDRPKRDSAASGTNMRIKFSNSLYAAWSNARDSFHGSEIVQGLSRPRS
jgi:hypothetical protein